MSNVARKLALGALVAVACIAPSKAAHADEIKFGANDIPTAFFISKSDDKNRVDYGLRLDASCVPVNDDALFPYWREFEKSPPVRTHGLGMLEYVPYGVSSQKLTKKLSNGAEYTVELKQFSRGILIVTKKESDGKCSATSYAKINGKTAQFVSVFAKLAGAMSVDYIDIFGKALDTNADVTERIKK